MKRSTSYFCSTIGQKQLVALSGLALCGFVISHAAGNLLIIFSADAYNKYSHALVSNPLIYFAEAILAGMFVLHLSLALYLTVKNRCARPTRYAVKASNAKAGEVIAPHMWKQGIIIFGFLIYHLVTFKFGTYYSTTIEGVTMRDMYKLVVECFQSPLYTGFYVFVMVVLGFHLAHGFHSSLQTLGFNHPKHSVKVKILSRLFGVFIAVTFAIQPLYVIFFTKG
jgi:succinate dehydrogenase / fumarate reductase cytochrome b subunit